MSRKYDASSIEVLSPIEGIRRRPGMYVGGTDSHAINHIAYEGIDNAIDEFLADRNHMVEVAIRDESVWIGDSGRGIPCEIHPKTKISTLTTVFTYTHAGGKFGSEAYGAAVGVHGVGIKATNALSAELEVWTQYKKKWWYIQFKKGVPVGKAAPMAKAPKFPKGMGATGTVIRFVPDKTIFHKGAKLLLEPLRARLEIASYINAELVVRYSPTEGEWEEFYHENGLLEFAEKRFAEANIEPKCYFEHEDDLTTMCLGVITEGKAPDTLFYTNSVTNPLKGRHATTMWKALYDTLHDLPGKHDFTAEELHPFFGGALNVHIKEPQFSTQTKEKLVDKRADAIYAGIVKEFTKWAKHKDNKDTVNAILEGATLLYNLRHNNKQAAGLAKELKEASKAKNPLPDKLAICAHAKPEQRELYCVEGDSAAGFCKLARDKGYQEVLTLKGKPLNCAKAAMEKVYDNEEVFNILLALGYQPMADNPYDKLRVKGKLILFADGDEDGKHITLLLLAMISVMLPELFERGMVYMIETPEYAAFGAKDQPTLSAGSKEDLQKLIGSKRGYRIQHMKGLGEATQQFIKDVGFDQKTRIMKQITVDDLEDIRSFLGIMGPDGTVRKELVGIDMGAL